MADTILNLLRSQIRNALSSFVELGDEINFGLGAIVLENVILKVDGLVDGMQFDLPIKLLKGSVGKIVVNLGFFSGTYRVELTQLAIEAELNDASKHLPSSEEFAKYMEASIQFQVNCIWAEMDRVLKSLPAMGPLLGDDDDKTYVGSTIAQIKSNIRVQVSEVQFKLYKPSSSHGENDDAERGYLLAALQTLDLFTCDTDFVNEFYDKNGDRVIRKVLNIRGLEIIVEDGEQVLGKTDLDGLITLDANPLHPTDHMFGKDIRLLFLTSLDLTLSLRQVKSLLVMSAVMSKFTTAIERMRSAFTRKREQDFDLPQLINAYEPHCIARLTSKNLLVASADAAAASELEMKIPTVELRKTIVANAKRHKRDPAVLLSRLPSSSFDSMQRNMPDFQVFPLLSKFPLMDEFDLVFNSRVNCKALEDGKLVLWNDQSACEAFPGLINSSFVVGVNGFSLEELASTETKLLVFESAKLPLKVRFVCQNSTILPGSSMKIKVMVPNLRVQMTEPQTRGVLGITGPATLTTTATILCVFGLDFESENVLYWSSTKLGVLGIEGSWLFGGMGKKNVDLNTVMMLRGNNAISFSPFERTALLTIPSTERWTLVNARPWRNVDAKPLVSKLRLVTVFDTMRISGAVGTLGLCINEPFQRFMKWQQQALYIPPSAQEIALVPMPPVITMRGYSVDFQLQAVQIHFDEHAAGEEALVIGIEQFKIQPSVAMDDSGVTRIASSLQLVVSPNIALISVPKLDVVLVGQDYIGVSVCVMPKTITLSKCALRTLLFAQTMLNEALAQPSTTQVSTLDEMPPAPELADAESHDAGDIVNICKEALQEALQVMPTGKFNLSSVEATDLYSALRRRIKTDKLAFNVGLQCHSLDDLVQHVSTPASLPQAMMQVGLLIADFRLRGFDQWELRFRDLTFGMQTNVAHVGDVSCTLEIGNLRFEEVRHTQARNYRVFNLGHLMVSYHAPALSATRIEPRSVLPANVQLVSMGSNKVKPPICVPIENQFFGTGRNEVVDLIETTAPDEIRLRVEGFQIRLTFAIVNSLIETMNMVNAVMAAIAPPPSLTPPQTIPPPAPSSSPPSHTLLTFSLFGVDMAFEDLAQSAPKKNVILSFGGDRRGSDLFPNEEFLISLYFDQHDEGQKLVARVHNLCLKLIVSEFTKNIEHTRLRTILNPMVMSLSYEKGTSAAGMLHSNVEVDFTKPVSFSFWAEEIMTLQAVLDSLGHLPQPAPVAEEDLPPPVPVAGSSRALSSSSMLTTAVARQRSERRVTFEDARSSTDMSFYTAEEMDSDAGLHGQEETMSIKVSCSSGIALEVVKRSLGRISSGSFLPVLLFSLKPLTATLRTQSMCAKDFAMTVFFSSEALIHNSNLGVWEPLLERFNVEVRARKGHKNHLECSLWISSRVNLNISETDIRLLSKLTEDFSATNKGKGSTGLKRNIVLEHFTPNDYGVANFTGSNIQIVQLYQVGCSLPGTLSIEVRDAWTLPARERWQKTPTLVARVLPWSDVVINYVPAHKDEIWSVRPLSFSFRYPGTTGDFPSLELVVTDDTGEELTASVALAPHIVVPNKDGISEWIQLAGKRGIQSEMLLRISYEYDDSSVRVSESTAQAAMGQVIAPGDVEPVSFEGVPPNVWVSNLSRSQFLKKGSQNTMRLAKLSFDLPHNLNNVANLEVDETNAYMLKLGRVEVFIKSAMRPGGKRMIQIESPLLVVNDSFANLEIIICPAITVGEMATTIAKQADNEEPVDDEQHHAEGHVPVHNLVWEVVRDDSHCLVFQAAPVNEDGESVTVFPNLVKFNPLSVDLPRNWTLKGYSVVEMAWIVLCSREVCESMAFPILTMGHYSHFQIEFPPVAKDARADAEGLELVGLDSIELFQPIITPAATWICSICDEVNEGDVCSLCAQPHKKQVEADADGPPPPPQPDVTTEDCLLIFDHKSVPVKLRMGRSSGDLKIFAVSPSAVLKRVNWKTVDHLDFEDNNQVIHFVHTKQPQLNFALKFTNNKTELPYNNWKRRFENNLSTSKTSLKTIKRLVKKRTSSKGGSASVGTAPLYMVQQRSVFTKMLTPGTGFAIPLQFLMPATTDMQVYLHPVGSSSCALLIEDLTNFKDALHSRTWLRCKDPKLSAVPSLMTQQQPTNKTPDFLLSAHVQSRFIPYKVEEAAPVVDTRNNRVKFRIVPWLIVQNGLPYTITFRFFLGLTPREEVYKLLPGRERGFFDVDEHSLVQFRLEDYNSNFTEWSSTLLPYREDTTEFAATGASEASKNKRRFPKRRDYFSIPHIKEGFCPLSLVMERSNDAKTSLRCVVYSTCWMYNYSDLGISLKMGKTLLRSSTAVLSSSTSSSSNSFLFPPKLTSQACDVQPGLVTLPAGENDLVFGRMCGVLGWDEENLKLVMDRFSTERAIQPMTIVKNASLMQQQQQQQQQPVVCKKLIFSRPKFNFKLTSAVYPCEFVFSNGEVRFVSIEIQRPDAPPFNRSLQIIVRPRYMLQNLLPRNIIVFKESSGGVLPAVIPSHHQHNVLSAATNKQDPFFCDEEGNECSTLEVTAPFSAPRSEQASGLKQIELMPKSAPIPFHFSVLKSAHSFTFAMLTTTNNNAAEEEEEIKVERTRDSGEMILDQTKEEALYCVSLRSPQEDYAEEANAARIRVSLKPHANGSIIVKFNQDAPHPMFKIDNRTSYCIEVKQTKTKLVHNILVAPGSSSPIGFDEPMKPTFVSMRVLVHKDEVPHIRRVSAMRFWKFSSHEEIHRGDNVFVPVSKWQVYPMETVSERDPLRLNGGEELAVEGVVDGSSLVLRITAEDATSPSTPSGKSTSCLLAIKVLSGQNLNVCRNWAGSSSSSFHPYVVVSVGGKTKQNTTPTRGDSANPNWAEDVSNKQKNGLVFELNEVPQFISCTLLNENPEIRDVLAVARIPVPKSFFSQHLHTRARNNTHDMFFDVEGDDTTTAAAAAATTTAVHDEEDGWVEIDSELWKSWRKRDQEEHREEVLQDGRSLSGASSKQHLTAANNTTANNVASFPLLQRQKSMRFLPSSRTNGEVKLRPIFAKPEDENVPLKVTPKLRIAVKIIRLPTNAQAFVHGYETNVRFEMNSFGISLMNASKSQEIAYLCLQRTKMRVIQTLGSLFFESSLGNFQIDNLVPDAQFPIAIHPASTVDNFVDVQLFILQSHPTVRFLETVRVSIQQLDVALEEKFLSEVAGVFARGLVDQAEAVVGFTAAEVDAGDSAVDLLKPPTLAGVVPFSDEAIEAAVAASAAGGGAEKMHLLYFDTFEIRPLRMRINLDLEGGRSISEAEEDAVKTAIRGMIPIISLDVRDLYLKISGVQRTGWFVPQTTWRGTVLRHFVRQALMNSGKVLASTNWAGNPIQAGRNVMSGFYFLVTEPMRGANEDRFKVMGFCSGLSSGVTAFFAGVATGLSETVHGVSTAVVNSYNIFHVAMEYDVTTRPMASLMEILRDVSGALAASAREIKEEVITTDKQEITHVRATPREFGDNGMVVAYGPGRLPAKQTHLLERQAAKRIVRWYVRTKRTRNQVSLAHLASDHYLLEQHRLQQELENNTEEPKDCCACCLSVKQCFVSFTEEIDEVRNAASAKRRRETM